MKNWASTGCVLSLLALAALSACDSNDSGSLFIAAPTSTPGATLTATPRPSPTPTAPVRTPTATATHTAAPTATATPGGSTAAHGALFVADQGNFRVHVFLSPFSNGINAGLAIGAIDLSSVGTGIASTTQSSVGTPTWVAFDKTENLWLTDDKDSRVLRFPTPFSTGMNADLVLGQSDFTSMTVATTQSGIANPLGVAVDGSGDVFVADTGNNRILEFEPPLSNGMNATVVIGQPDFISSGGFTSQSGLHTPVGLQFDTAGNLWVADDDNNRVLEFKPPFTTGMNASLVLGEPDFNTANDVAPSQNSLNGPTGVAADNLGNVFVVDTNNNRVLEYKTPLSNGMNANVVLGQADFTHATIGTTQNQLEIPRFQVAFDGSGNLWVTDNANNRVLQFKPPFTTGMNASLVIGQSDFTTSSNTGGISGLSTPLGAAVKP